MDMLRWSEKPLGEVVCAFEKDYRFPDVGLWQTLTLRAKETFYFEGDVLNYGAVSYEIYGRVHFCCLEELVRRAVVGT